LRHSHRLAGGSEVVVTFSLSSREITAEQIIKMREFEPHRPATSSRKRTYGGREVQHMKCVIGQLIPPFSLISLVLMQGCVTPQQAQESAERALQKTEDIQAQQIALENRTDLLEENAKKLEQKIDADSLAEHAKVRDTLALQDAKNKEDSDRLRGYLNNRLDEVQKQMEVLRADLLNAIQSTNGTSVQKVDKRLDSLDLEVRTLLQRIEELEKRLQKPRRK